MGKTRNFIKLNGSRTQLERHQQQQKKEEERRSWASREFNSDFFFIYRKYGKVKILRSLPAVKRHLAQYPDPELDINTFNNLKQYRKETERLKKEEEGRRKKIQKEEQPIQPSMNIQNDEQQMQPVLNADNDIQNSLSMQLKCGWGSIVEKVKKFTDNRYLNLIISHEVSKCDALEVSYKKNFHFLVFHIITKKNFLFLNKQDTRKFQNSFFTLL